MASNFILFFIFQAIPIRNDALDYAINHIPPPHQHPPKPNKPQADLNPEGRTQSSIGNTAWTNWLRVAVVGAINGLVLAASIMIGVEAVNHTAKDMVVPGLAGLVAAACNFAIRRSVSVYALYDTHMAQMVRERDDIAEENAEDEDSLPRLAKSAGASALAFMLGGLLPLLTCGFVGSWWARMGVACAVTSLGLGGLGAALGFLRGASATKFALRVLIGEWSGMLVTGGLLALFVLVFKMQVLSA